MKTVYGKIFRKPFSKTREAFCSLPLLSFSALCSLPLLSFSALSTLCYLSLLSLLSFFAGPIGFVFLCSLGLIRGTNTESFKIDTGAARTDWHRPRSGPDEAGENIQTPIGFLFLCSLSWLICGGRWWVAGWVLGWVAVASRSGFRGGFGWLAVVLFFNRKILYKKNENGLRKNFP